MESGNIIADDLANGTMDVRVKGSKKLLGCFMKDVDGYYYFWSLKGLDGCWSSESLIEIGKLLKKLNFDHEQEISKYFENEKNTRKNKLDN